MQIFLTFLMELDAWLVARLQPLVRTPAHVVAAGVWALLLVSVVVHLA